MNFGQYGVAGLRFKIPKLLSLAGCGCLGIVVLTHVAEHWQLLPSTRWGLPNSAGHYLDLASAIAGPTLFFTALLCKRISE